MRMSASRKMPVVQYSITNLGGGTTSGGVSYPGGLDLTTPGLVLQPGALRAGQNFECSQTGGYARIDGYERLDGRPKPHAATFQIIQIASFTNVPSVGQTISQASSGASAVVLLVNNIPGNLYLVVTKVMMIFDGSGQIAVGPTIIGNQAAQTALITPQQNAQYLSLAANNYRADIGMVPGTGNILGVVGMVINNVDNVFAFRANVGNTAVNLYKATSSGWVQVPFFYTVQFTVGSTTTPMDGDTLTQGGVTATILRTQWQSGSFSGNNAVGQLVITAPAGGNFSNGTATTTSGSTVTITAKQAAISLALGGKFQFVKGNFSGQLVTRRIYGCDGANPCFELGLAADNTTIVLAPIATGNSPDTPTNIAFHKNFLFVSQASSIFYCGAGTPFKWDATDGGGEIATGDVVTGMITVPGSQTTATLAVFLRGNTAFLYGIDPSTFNFVSFNTGTGALQYSVQNLFDTCVFDDLGAITLKTTLNWGNFLPSTLTKNILPFVQQERGRLSSSSVNRAKSQYRVWFSDGFGLWLTLINQQYMGAAITFFPDPVLCSDEADLANGGMTSYFGSSSGYVFELDAGTSFDGVSINAFITMAWDHIKTPRILKRFRAASVEMQGGSYAQVSFGYLLGYGQPNIGQAANQNMGANFSEPPVWDSFVWDAFIWDGQTLSPADVPMTGTGENVQVTISCNSDYMASFGINSVIYHFTPRRGIRP